MEEKARLMIESQKMGQAIDDIHKKIESLQKDIKSLPMRCQQEQIELRQSAEKDFLQRNASQLQRVKQICADKRKAASDLLDTFTDLGVQEFAGKYEIKDLEEHLMQVYPPALIEDYVCLNPIEFEDERQAYQMYSVVENSVIGLKQSNLSGAIFEGLSSMLNAASDNPRIGMKVAFAFIIFIAGGLILSPFLFLSCLTLFGVFSALQGVRVQRILRQLFSIKLFLNNAYDEDIFAADKEDIMQMVDSFLEDAEREYCGVIEQRVFEFDDSQLLPISKKYDLERQRLESALDLRNQELLVKQQELEKLLNHIDELAEQEKKYAELARKKFLGTIEWKKEWLSNIFLETTPEHKVKVMPFAQGNSLYYSNDVEKIKCLSRLIVFQCMIQMHPDYACNFILDYKYNGGELTQFVNSPERIVKICFSEDDISSQVEFINNDIRARTNNILSSCESIEEFNQLMASYNSAGQYYVIVHVFGISSLPSQFLNNIRNGPRVGYFFKFYLTTEELSDIADVFPLDAMKDFQEVLNNPTPRTQNMVSKLLKS